MLDRSTLSNQAGKAVLMVRALVALRIFLIARVLLKIKLAQESWQISVTFNEESILHLKYRKKPSTLEEIVL